MGSELGGNGLSCDGGGGVLQRFAAGPDKRDDILDYNAQGTHPLRTF